MKTYPMYLDDSYQKEMSAQILTVVPESEGRYRLILDKTVFYPMGGGQPTDQGTLTSPSWSGTVYQVQTRDGEIWHYVQAATAPTVGDTIHGVINWERRYKHMQIHTAGHIIDFAIFLLGYSPKQLSPVKGAHGKKPYIVYQGVLQHDIRQPLQEKVNELIRRNLSFSWGFQSLEELQKEAIYLQPNLPTHKPLRTFRLETVGAVADGGTQLRTTGEAGSVQVTDIQTKDNTTTIFYRVA